MQRAMLGFFKYAHEIHGGEAALVLLHHPERRLFRWPCPEQTIELDKSWTGWVASDIIRFKNPFHLPDGSIQFGDAHLYRSRSRLRRSASRDKDVGNGSTFNAGSIHPGPPIPSAVDTHDDHDGLHIIAGDIKTGPIDHFDFVMDGARFPAAPDLIFEDPHCEPFARPPRRWLKQVNLQTTVPIVDEQEIPQPMLHPANNNGEGP